MEDNIINVDSQSQHSYDLNLWLFMSDHSNGKYIDINDDPQHPPHSETRNCSGIVYNWVHL